MKLNKSLAPNADRNPTKESRQITIDQICTKIDSGELTMPLYQRDLSWTLQKCVALLNYQLRGKAPVSAISINVVNDVKIAVPQVTFIDRDPVKTITPGLNSVVDGQQRITTNYKAYIDSEDFRNIVLDLVKGKFLIVKNEALIEKHQIPVGVLMYKDQQRLTNYVVEHKLTEPDVYSVILQVRNKFKNYYYTVNQAMDMTESEQIEWFEVLNNAGSRVSGTQMKLATLKLMGIDIYTQYTHKYVDKVTSKGYGDIFTQKSTDVSYPICALNPAIEVITGKKHSRNSCPMAPDAEKVKTTLKHFDKEQILHSFDLTLAALDKALDFIDSHDINIQNRGDYINFLTGYFVFHPGDLSEIIEDYLVDWCRTQNFGNTSNSERRDIFSKLIEVGSQEII